MNFKAEFDTVGYVIVDDAIDPAGLLPFTGPTAHAPRPRPIAGATVVHRS